MELQELVESAIAPSISAGLGALILRTKIRNLNEFDDDIPFNIEPLKKAGKWVAEKFSDTSKSVGKVIGNKLAGDGDWKIKVGGTHLLRPDIEGAEKVAGVDTTGGSIKHALKKTGESLAKIPDKFTREEGVALGAGAAGAAGALGIKAAIDKFRNRNKMR